MMSQTTRQKTRPIKAASTAALMGASPVMAQIGPKVLPLQTRFSQPWWIEVCGGRLLGNRTYRVIVQEKSPALAGMSGNACIGGRAHPCA
jgi:hypothetical protein